MKKILILTFTLILALLAGCGGGGGGGGSTSANTAPVSKAGGDQHVATNTPVTLNGSSSSDANGDPLIYNWSFSSRPGGSSATLANATSAIATFTPDVAGSYVLDLVVNDGKASTTSTVTVTASYTTAVLKLSALDGIPSGQAVVGFDARIELPDGVTVQTVPGGGVAANVVVPSGVLAGSNGNLGPVLYTPATGAARARLDISIASTVAAGVGIGEYATITFALDNVAPVAADFKVLTFNAYNQSFEAISSVTPGETLVLK